MSGDFDPEVSEVEDVAEGEVLEGAVDAASGVPEAGDDAIAEGASEDAERSTYEQVVGERDEYLDALRRLQAEFDNYRKRTLRQQTELLERATESLIERLLPALDALDLAVEHAPPDEEGDAEMEASVLPQIGTMLRDVLVKEGLERIDTTEVEFDPTIHDAVAHVPTGDEDSGAHLIDEVLRPGYRLKGRVLRPAMVRVRG
ncbi:MAG TPA: nucleotide exchange factor GrpE [Acidimicrobiales bacterium]|nr:nucleotide exchange factor GrpE [Acidimicrobiales bacterium]